MKAKLMVDLTKYNKVFCEGKICTTNGVPVVHPNIKWQTCYVLRAEGRSLVVGKGSVKLLDDDNSDLCQEDMDAVAAFTEGKMFLADILGSIPAVVLDMSEKGHVRALRCITPETDTVSTIKKIGEMEKGTLDNSITAILGNDWLRIYGDFIKEFLECEKTIDFCQVCSMKQSAVIRRDGKTSTRHFNKFNSSEEAIQIRNFIQDYKIKTSL